MTPPAARVGWGIDAHSFNDRPPLLLAGVVVSEVLGVEATSDGDVLAHAVSDAILGACVLGDLGDHFPSSDPKMSGANSMEMLRRVVEQAGEAGWVVRHLDATIITGEVRMAPHRPAIRSALADALRIDSALVSVKATGTDGLGFTGRGEGMMVNVVVTVEPAS